MVKYKLKNSAINLSVLKRTMFTRSSLKKTLSLDFVERAVIFGKYCNYYKLPNSTIIKYVAREVTAPDIQSRLKTNFLYSCLPRLQGSRPQRAESVLGLVYEKCPIHSSFIPVIDPTKYVGRDFGMLPEIAMAFSVTMLRSKYYVVSFNYDKMETTINCYNYTGNKFPDIRLSNLYYSVGGDFKFKTEFSGGPNDIVSASSDINSSNIETEDLFINLIYKLSKMSIDYRSSNQLREILHSFNDKMFIVQNTSYLNNFEKNNAVTQLVLDYNFQIAPISGSKLFSLPIRMSPFQHNALSKELHSALQNDPDLQIIDKDISSIIKQTRVIRPNIQKQIISGAEKAQKTNNLWGEELKDFAELNLDEFFK